MRLHRSPGLRPSTLVFRSLLASWRPLLGWLSVLALVAAGAPAQASTLDFAFGLDAFDVSGNLTFSDDFEDGLRNDPPTDQLVDLFGGTSESGGALRFGLADGFMLFDDPLTGLVVRNDTIQLSSNIEDFGTGTSLVEAAFLPDLPTGAGPAGNGYGLVLSADFGGVLFAFQDCDFAARPQDPFCGPSDAGLTMSVLLSNFAGETILGTSAVDSMDVVGNIVLQFTIDHADDEAIAAYSLDGGMTFIDDFASSAALFLDQPSVSVEVFAEEFIVPEPGTVALLGAGLLGLAAARRGRRARS